MTVSKKEIFWLCMLLIGSVLIGRLLMGLHNANVAARQAGLTDADLAGFQEPSANHKPAAPPNGAVRRPLPKIPADTPPVLLLAAASTIDLVNEFAVAQQQQTGLPLKISTGGSNALAQQILHGAPADLFLSAEPSWVELLAAKGLMARRADLLGNDLVLVVPKGNPAQIQTPQDLLKPAMQHLALAGEQVPAGKYAEQALAKLGLLQPLLDGKRIVRGADVRAACGYVMTGEAQAGIVYASDGLQSANLCIYTFPADTHEPILYTLVLIQREGRSPAAEVYFDALCGAYAELRWNPEKFGFKRLHPIPVNSPVPVGPASAPAPGPAALSASERKP